MERMTCMYETDADLAREAVIIKKFLAQYPGCKAVKLPRSTHADFGIVNARGKMVLYIEVKQRFAPRGKFPDYWIGESRLHRLVESARRAGVTPLLLVAWEDGLGYVEPQKALDNAKISHGGRRDRNDARDLERMASFSYDLFTMLAS